MIVQHKISIKNSIMGSKKVFFLLYMYLFNLLKVSKTGGEILGADMIYNYEQVLRQVRAGVKYKTSNKNS